MFYFPREKTIKTQTLPIETFRPFYTHIDWARSFLTNFLAITLSSCMALTHQKYPYIQLVAQTTHTHSNPQIERLASETNFSAIQDRKLISATSHSQVRSVSSMAQPSRYQANLTQNSSQHRNMVGSLLTALLQMSRLHAVRPSAVHL